MLRKWFFAAVVVAMLLALCPEPARAQGGCAQVNGTITGQFDTAGAQGPGWYGQVYVSFGKSKAVFAGTLYDQGSGRKEHPTFKPDLSGNFAGYETLHFDLPGLGTFSAKGQFIAVAGTTPYMYSFGETAKVVDGDGAFTAMTGNLSIHGSFVVGGGIPAGPAPDHPWVWIAQITGSVCGVAIPVQ